MKSSAVEVAPLGRRFGAAVVDRLPLVLIEVLWLLVVRYSAHRLILSVALAMLLFGYVMVQWWLYATRKAGLGFALFRLQLVKMADGKAIGWGRMCLRTLISYSLWLLIVPGIIMVIFLSIHERRQGWHDRAVGSLAVTQPAPIQHEPRVTMQQRSSGTVELPAHMLTTSSFSTGEHEPSVPIQHAPQGGQMYEGPSIYAMPGSQGGTDAGRPAMSGSGVPSGAGVPGSVPPPAPVAPPPPGQFPGQFPGQQSQIGHQGQQPQQPQHYAGQGQQPQQFMGQPGQSGQFSGQQGQQGQQYAGQGQPGPGAHIPSAPMPSVSMPSASMSSAQGSGGQFGQYGQVGQHGQHSQGQPGQGQPGQGQPGQFPGQPGQGGQQFAQPAQPGQPVDQQAPGQFPQQGPVGEPGPGAQAPGVAPRQQAVNVPQAPEPQMQSVPAPEVEAPSHAAPSHALTPEPETAHGAQRASGEASTAPAEAPSRAMRASDESAAPAPSPAAAPAPAPAAVAEGAGDRPQVRVQPRPVPSDAEDSTRLVGQPRVARVGTWMIRLDDGRDVQLSTPVLLGRKPAARDGDPEDVQLVPSGEPSSTVSRTHLLIGVDTSGLYVIDRGSTNGTAVALGDGSYQPCPAHERCYVRDGQVVSFGERQFVVKHRAD